LNNLKILIVDDDVLSTEFMSIFLESEGFQITCSTSVQEAIAAFDRELPSVVVTDIQLSDGTGMDLALYIKQKQKDVRIIAVTGFQRDQLQDKGCDLGLLDAILTKPIDLMNLTLAINPE